MPHTNLEDLIKDENALKLHIKSILQSRPRRLIPKDDLRESAVLIPLSFEGGEPSVVVTKRSMTVEHHQGEISFPGGRSEPRSRSRRHRPARGRGGDRAQQERREVLGLLDDHISILGYHMTRWSGPFPPVPVTINAESESCSACRCLGAEGHGADGREDHLHGPRGPHLLPGDRRRHPLGASARIFHFVDLIAGRTIELRPRLIQGKGMGSRAAQPSDRLRHGMREITQNNRR